MRKWIGLALVLSFSLVPARAADAPKVHVVLDAHGAWRGFFVWQAERVQWKSGDVTAFRVVWKRNPKTRRRAPVMEKVQNAPPSTGAPPASWNQLEFDDGTWIASPGPIRHASVRRDLAAMYLRGRFHVADPAKVADLTLSLSFRGGAVVYLNGRELVRKHLPDGDLTPTTPAEAYPKEAYVDADGRLLVTTYDRRKRRHVVPEGMRLRTRRISGLRIPRSALRKGVNVLAVELHRAPTSEYLYKGAYKRRRPDWSMLGLDGLTLTAATSAGLAAPPALSVWPGSPLVDAWDRTPSPGAGKVEPVRIVAARNGAFSGVVMLRSTRPVRRLDVMPGDLARDGGGTIPASAVQVRYAVPGDPPPQTTKHQYPRGARYLGALAESFPGEVKVPEGATGVTVPLWLTVKVGRDVPAGEYRGIVRVAVNGEAVEVPLEVSVEDFVLPDVTAFASHAGLIESPESVALRYGVELWSDAHWKLLDRVFRLLGRVRVQSVFLPIVAHTNLGNQQSMVRWIKQPDGTWKHDFTVIEKYLDLVVKYLGKVPVVCLYVWTPAHGGGSFGRVVAKRQNYRPMWFTVLDPVTGKTREEKGPDWGTPESVPFWKPVFEGLRKRLAERGMAESLALGLVCDFTPSKEAVEDLKAVEPNARWVVHSHGRATKFAGKPVAALAHVWGTSGPFLSTRRARRPGWTDGRLVSVFPRWGAGSIGHLRANCPIGSFHAATECYQASGYDGVGRVGADFWPVLKGRRGKVSVVNRYAYRNRPGPPTMGNGSFLYPAKDGPVATVRFEALRLGMQETEARIFVERALMDRAGRARLGKALAAKAQAFLDDRIRAILRAKAGYKGRPDGSDASWLWYAGQWPASTRRLFRLAAQVAKALRP